MAVGTAARRGTTPADPSTSAAAAAAAGMAPPAQPRPRPGSGHPVWGWPSPADWTTPASIRLLAGLCLVAVAAVLVVTALAVSGARSGLSVIGRHTAPEVVSTSGLYFALNDMDAQVANVLLVANEPNLGLTRHQSLDLYEQDRLTVDKNLQQATILAGTDTGAQSEIRAVIDGLGEYEALAAQAILLEGQGNPVAGGPPGAALAAFRQATDLMHATVLSAAQKLTDTNTATLDRTYRDRRASTSRALWAVLLFGTALVLALLAIQRYLVVHFHRLLNPALATGALLAVGLVAFAATTLSGEADHLKVAKQDAFDSLVVLSQARAISYDANADESRYLVDPERAAQYQQSFLDKTEQIVHLPGATIGTYDAALAGAITAYQANHGDIRFTGFFGTEFRNITFVGERAAAEQTLLAFQVYQRDDRRLRALDEGGHLREAIRFDTSFAPADSNGAFNTSDAALVKLTQINQHAFDQAIRDGEHQLGGWAVIPILACLAIAALVIAGCRSRLAEYR